MIILIPSFFVGCGGPSPSKSFDEIRVAVQTNDRLRFDRYVDLDRLANHAVDTVISQGMAETMSNDTADGMEQLGAALGMAMMEGLKPAMVETVKTQILKVVDGKPTGGEGKSSTEATDGLMKIFGNGISAWAIGEVKEDGPLAIVSLPFQNDDIGEMNLDLKFEKTESGDWVLVELANLSRILEKQQGVEASKKAQRQ